MTLYFGAPEVTQSAAPLDYASLAFRFLFAKKLPPAVFLHAKSPLRVRVPLIQTQNKKSHLAIGFLLFGAPEGTRPPDLLVRSQSLYPAELRAHMLFPNTNDMIQHFLVFVKSFLEFF